MEEEEEEAGTTYSTSWTMSQLQCPSLLLAVPYQVRHPVAYFIFMILPFSSPTLILSSPPLILSSSFPLSSGSCRST